MKTSLVLIVCLTALAEAHQSSIKYVELRVGERQVEVALKVAPSDVTEPMKLSADAKPAAREAAQAPGVAAYVAAWLAISVPPVSGTGGEQPCVPGPASARADVESFVVVTWSVTCPNAIAHLTLDLARFFAIDKRMEAIVQLESDDEITPIVVRAGDSPITLRIAGRSLGRWIRYGMDTFAQLDHVAFVLAMLLAVVIERRQRWQVTRIGSALHAAAVVVGAFTIPHVLAFVAGALGWITMSAALLGWLCAAATAYVAAETIARPAATRSAIVAAFGLVFGLAFAMQLRAFTGTGTAAVICFGVGLELAQLTLVMIALPTCYLVASVIGGDRYRKLAIPVVGGALFAFAVVRVLQRAFGM